MATKIKGEAIKEGSIGLNALSNNAIKELNRYGLYNYYGTLGNGVTEINIEGSEYGIYVYYNNKIRYISSNETAQLNKVFGGATASLSFNSNKVSILDNSNSYILDIFGGYHPLRADWNGDYNIGDVSEMVQIYNRTHFSSKLIYDKTVDNIVLYRQDYNVDTNDVYIRDATNKYVKLSNTDSTKVLLYSSLDLNEYLVSYNAINKTVSIYSETTDVIDPWGDFEYLDIIAVVKLEDMYIPDTIARKSDIPDIDPVVWKYMLNPLVIKEGDKVPEELIGDFAEDEGDRYNLKYPYLNMYLFKYNDTTFRPSSINDVGIEFDDIYAHDLEVEDIRIVRGAVIIDEDKKWHYE